MALEGRETSNSLAPELKRRHAVRDALLCVRDDRNDRVAQLSKRCSLGLVKSAEVLVDLVLGHSGILKVGVEGVKGAIRNRAITTTHHRPKRSSVTAIERRSTRDPKVCVATSSRLILLSRAG